MTKANLARTVWCERGWMPFYYGFCPSEKAWRRTMGRMGLSEVPYPKAAAHCMSFDNPHGDRCSIVTVNEANDKKLASGIIGLIAHEAMHVWQELMERIGESAPSSEWGAYSYQAIFQELLEAYVATRNPKLLRQSQPKQKQL